MPAMRPIAIVGMGVALPGASSPDDLWALLRQDAPVWERPQASDPVGFDDFFDPDPDAQDRTYGRVYGQLSNLRPHPRLRQELAAGNAPAGPSARWLRHTLMQTLDTVRLDPGHRCLLAAGLSTGALNELEHALVLQGAAQRLGELAFGPGLESVDRARRVLAERYPLARTEPERSLPHRILWLAQRDLLPAGSELVAIDSACSAGSFCVDAGIRALLADDVDVALCGGVNTVTASEYVSMSKVGGVSQTGRLRALDATADGTVFSEGAAMVALKLLDRARADGDDVLAVITGCGTSSDGRGGIFTPDAEGQRLAIERARASAAVPASHIDWIIGHAIGMPRGDATELTAISGAADPDGCCPVTSFKSLLGHPSYASGVISLINAVLGLRHHTIPAQRQFDSAPADFSAGTGPLTIPTEDLPLPPRPDRPRHVGSSCFGFGGTNSHMIVSDRPSTAATTPPAAATANIVLVGWGAHLPGTPTRQDLRTQLEAGQLTGPLTFGDPYPTPPPGDVALPPRTLRQAGRAHPMILQSVADLIRHHNEPWKGLNDTTGVFSALTGPTDTAVAYQLRIHLDAIRHALESTDNTDAAELNRVFDKVAEQIRDTVPPSNTDTVIALLTNCVAARVTKRFKLRGSNVNVDQGIDSTLAAVRMATRALATGTLDVALVCGVACDPGPETTTLLRLLNPGLPPIAEGAFALALTTEHTAAAQGLDVLAQIRPATAESTSALRNGPAPDRTYLGADGAIAILRAALRPDADTLVLPHGGTLGANNSHGIDVERRVATPRPT